MYYSSSVLGLGTRFLMMVNLQCVTYLQNINSVPLMLMSPKIIKKAVIFAVLVILLKRNVMTNKHFRACISGYSIYKLSSSLSKIYFISLKMLSTVTQVFNRHQTWISSDG